MKHPQDETMTIGAFAKRSRLSMKALRLYDEMGLLAPRYVDPDNGYRYYTDSQVDRARLIGHLRQLEMPLATIAMIIDLPPDAAAESIVTFWSDVEAAMSERRWLVEFLTSHIINEGEAMYPIATRSVPEQVVLTEQQHVVADALPQFIGDAMTSLFETAGGAVAGSPFVVYHGQVTMDSDGPVEVCVPVSDEAAADAVSRTEPAHREAYTRITKGQVKYPQILEAYSAVENWASENNVGIIDSPREVYFVDWETVGDDDPACDIVFPIEP
ncbi:MAG: MerR family transcriptional regulator [Acidimicrobiia bacterium]|nr:MerR family transcriptional regulator [Acidimicrobiia bacterium]